MMSVRSALRSASLVFSVTVFIIACGGSDSDVSLEGIQGIWDSSSVGDVRYTVIQPDGEILFYDYQADSAGTGDNCYLIEEIEDVISTVVVPNGSSYDFVLQSDEFTGIISKGISLNGDDLTLYDFDENSARPGSTPNTVVFTTNKSLPSETIGRVTGVDVSDLNLCDSTSVIQNDDPGVTVIESDANQLIQLAESVRSALYNF